MSDFADWIRQHLWAGWALAAVGLAAAEVLTLDLTLLMLAAGAAAGALTAAVLPQFFWLQIAVALVTAWATLFLLRPTLLEKVRRAPGYRSSLDSLVGSTGVVCAAIGSQQGEVKVDGQIWQAKAFNPELVIAAGDEVEVLAIEGLTLVVHPAHTPLSM